MKNNEELANQYMGLIPFVLKKLKLEHEDYYDIGLIGLAKAIKCFDPNKGIQFNTFAVNVIKRELTKQLMTESMQKRKGEKTKISLDKELKEGFTLKNFISNGYDLEDEILKREKINKLYEKMEILSEREKTIISLYYRYSYTYKEIGKALNISGTRVMQIHHKIISKLKMNYGVLN